MTNDLTNLQNKYYFDLSDIPGPIKKLTSTHKPTNMITNDSEQITDRNKKGQKVTSPGHSIQNTFVDSANGVWTSLQNGASDLQAGIADTISTAESQIVKINKKYEVKNKLNSSATYILENLQNGVEIIGDNVANSANVVQEHILNINNPTKPENVVSSANYLWDSIKNGAEEAFSLSSNKNSVKNSSIKDTLENGAISALEIIENGATNLIADTVSVTGEEISNITGDKIKNNFLNSASHTLDKVTNSAANIGEQLSASTAYVGKEISKVTKNVGQSISKWFSSIF